MMSRKQMALAVASTSVLGAWLLAFSGSPGAAASIEAKQEPPPGFELKGDVTAGGKIYKQYCQKCHGKQGNGQGLMAKDLDPKPRDFTDKARMATRSDWQIYLGIREGGPSVGLSEQMTGWKDTLTEQEMRDVAVYIRQFAK